MSIKPSKKDYSDIIKLFENKNYVAAESLALNYTKNFPKIAFGWKALAAIYSETNKIDKAITTTKKTLDINPNDFEAKSNLGLILRISGKLEDAEKSLKEAIIIKPNFPEAHNNLGVVLQDMGKLEEAKSHFKQSINLKTNFLEPYLNLADLYSQIGKKNKAIDEIIKILNLNQNFDLAYYTLGKILAKTRFNEENHQLEKILVTLLEKKIFVRPKYVARSILSLLEFNTTIKKAFKIDFTKNLSSSMVDIFEDLSQIDLLLKLLSVAPLPNLKFEKLFKNIRSKILLNINQLKTNQKFLPMLVALSCQCFLNEYIYDLNEDEVIHLESLKKSLKQKIKNNKNITNIEIACLSCYEQLNKHPWLKNYKFTTAIKKIELYQIVEPIKEFKLKKTIPQLKIIKNKVSIKVQKQYEENPYPRWINLSLRIPKSINEYFNEFKLRINNPKIFTVNKPKILVAGCGTGQNSITTASLFKDTIVTAIDLSMTSLRYAKRKTRELGFSNIKYLQADILDLELMGKEFDIIESSGVLHHMENPMLGWKKLSKSLKVGGLMRIGLYSKIARSDIIETRKKIKQLGIGDQINDLKMYREKLITSKNNDDMIHSSSLDFYTLSTFRDLLFHSQEHQFTIPQIENYLNDLNLIFCGFENVELIKRFKLKNKEINTEYDLKLWNDFEMDNQDIFLGMYQFWCQKI